MQMISTGNYAPNLPRAYAVGPSGHDVLDSFDDENSGGHMSPLANRIVQTVIDVIVIIIIFIIFLLVFYLLAPRIRYITCDQSDIFYPFLPDTIPFWAVGVYATTGPVLFIVAVEVLNAKLLPCQKSARRSTLPDRRRQFLVCTFHAISLFVLGISITLLLTEIGKRWVGRLRPHFISVCQPLLSSLNCVTPTQGGGQVYNAIYTGDTFCKGDLVKVWDARMSFPSGHSSYSCYCMLFLAVYLEARLVLLRLRYIKPLLQLGAIIAAYVTCVSRIVDYHHRGWDVVGGAVLGILVALFITFVVGRVLWVYKAQDRSCCEFDMKKVTRRF